LRSTPPERAKNFQQNHHSNGSVDLKPNGQWGRWYVLGWKDRIWITVAAIVALAMLALCVFYGQPVLEALRFLGSRYD
jgi:hypothetical protein